MFDSQKKKNRFYIYQIVYGKSITITLSNKNKHIKILYKYYIQSKIPLTPKCLKIKNRSNTKIYSTYYKSYDNNY